METLPKNSIADLIEQAKAKDPFFKRRIEYRIHGRQSPKPPDLEWLMPQLEEILGKVYVMNAANAYVEEMSKILYEIPSDASRETTELKVN